MAEPLSGEDFDLYYKSTLFVKDGKVFFINGRVDPKLVELKSGPNWEKSELVDWQSILEYVGKYPRAGYRNFTDFDVRYISFARDGTKKGPSRNGTTGVGGDNPWPEIFFPKYLSVEQAVATVNRGGLAAISPDLMISKQGEKICLMWKGFCVGRITRHNKVIISRLYSFLVPLIHNIIPVGDVR